MADRENWSNYEIALTVADYMHMLTLELSGQTYNKSAHRRNLTKQLSNRSEGAVELKHQNISAVLRDLNCFWIVGYKPRGNYQRSLAEYVEQWINSHPEFDHASRFAVEQPAFVPSDVDFARLPADAPEPASHHIEEPGSRYSVSRSPAKRDYVAQEARNSALGLAGELLVMEYEAFRLHSCGAKSLAERVEHVSKTKGDGLGYDILSFEASGKERLIEVKTTAFSKETPFYASRNEISCSEDFSEHFHLYRLFDFRRSPQFFSLSGSIPSHCQMDPVSYLCRVR